MLEQIKIDEPMGETDFADLILAISQLEDVRDIFAAPTEAEKVEIMNKWRQVANHFLGEKFYGILYAISENVTELNAFAKCGQKITFATLG